MNFFKKLFNKNSDEKAKLKKDFKTLEDIINDLDLRVSETISLFNEHNLNKTELDLVNNSLSLIIKAKLAKEVGMKLIKSNKLLEANSILRFLSIGELNEVLIELQDNGSINLENLNNFERTIERSLTQSGKTLKANNLKLKNKGAISEISRDHTVFDLDREALLEKMKED